MWSGEWKVCVLPALLIIGSASECLPDPCSSSLAHENALQSVDSDKHTSLLLRRPRIVRSRRCVSS